MTHSDFHLAPEAGIDYSKPILRNLSVAQLYEHALNYEPGTVMASSGALVTRSGHKTGRSPKDKRMVQEKSTDGEIWWGPVNIPLEERVFRVNHERAVDYLNTRERLYVFDGFAGWDPKYRIKVRVVCARAYHALFMRNMLIRPTEEELENFGEPDFTIFNAGQFPANRYTSGMTSTTSVAISFERRELVILGTQLACSRLHSSANEGPDGDVSLFFGLSGTGKTTLSADPRRSLIGDDEHCWSDDGIFNIEGGCYAKCIDLSAEKEPEIFGAIRFGSRTPGVPIPSSTSPTPRFLALAVIPKNILLLTCDAFGVLPPVAKLTPEQAMYHFISGYTAKIAGTEEGVTEPQATFSACFGQPFLAWHPVKYASMLAEKMKEHKTNVWLINTGWNGGAYGVGERISIKYSRAIINAIHSGELEKVEFEAYPVFNLMIPKTCSEVPDVILNPVSSWQGPKEEFESTLRKLAGLFQENFKIYQDQATEEIIAAGPRV
ncbi:phosphoenolpyruvate carboxykinase [ATP] [Basidiobolus meristosporus CBS 931.73]|uniref:Phosphoenolpyruvate carboxykinase (ATP) n=1 Tax=Basidiobolus meristosporus CBS 931.73 TaxID=1314790 RepID=A0A1Y1ZCG7_9FUNG|nr:phosphoenolpyruvate carboxykinase [ATP] [Basidiobolus meristosporus CBS 931.73]|eukprot:ORY07963.1 phosphoenolpyruvate carboxykinase [ATP] [Basidiobolus meristosporus CBS 931.73]